MSNKGINRRDYFKTAGAVAGLGIIGAGAGLGSSTSAGMLDGFNLVKSLGEGRHLDPNAGLSVVLLGTGTPIPSLDRACASTMVIAGDRTIIIDTGRGSSLRMAQAGVLNPSLLLYTHFHSDHITDFGEVVMNRFAMAGADRPLPVIGPVGVAKMVGGFLESYSMDKQYRVAHHGWAVNEHGYEVEITEAQPGVVYDDGGLTITMFEVNHLPVTPAVGYRFDYQGQSVVVSGDTKKVLIMTEMAQGCDILVHEAINEKLLGMGRGAVGASDRVKKMSADILEYHTMTDEVAEIARDAGVKKLVLTHMVPSPLNLAMEAMFVRGMRKIYRGPIKVGRDLMEVKA